MQGRGFGGDLLKLLLHLPHLLGHVLDSSLELVHQHLRTTSVRIPFLFETDLSSETILPWLPRALQHLSWTPLSDAD